jgi:multiple sugar transport system permease protein/sn-glycerol 3-phosphate transport system permease protein
MNERASGLSRVGLHLVVAAMCLLTLFPLFFMLSTAFKSPEDVFTRTVQLLPSSPTLDNFGAAFHLQPLSLWLLNSVITSVGITAGRLLISIPAAYAFMRFSFRGRGVLFALVVGTMIVPDIITILPNYVLVSDLGWIDTPQGVIVPTVAFTGFFVFLLRQAMLGLPREYIDASRVDGAGELRILWSIVLPLIRPMIVVVAILSFLHAWNLYLWPLLVLPDADAKTVTVGLQFILTNELGESPPWGPLMATAFIAMLPPLLLYVFAHRTIVRALTVEAGIKG